MGNPQEVARGGLQAGVQEPVRAFQSYLVETFGLDRPQARTSLNFKKNRLTRLPQSPGPARAPRWAISGFCKAYTSLHADACRGLQPSCRRRAAFTRRYHLISLPRRYSLPPSCPVPFEFAHAQTRAKRTSKRTAQANEDSQETSTQCGLL